MSRPALGPDPAVIAWQCVLAPRPRFRVGRHWWREYVTAAYQAARHAWELEADRVSIGYDIERAEYAAENPPPTLRTFLVGLSSGAIHP